MEFLVEFEVNVPAGAPTDQVEGRETAEAAAAARLAEEGHLVRLWKLPNARGQTRAVGLYRESPDSWREMQQNGMSRDFSWDVSAREYVRIYRGQKTDGIRQGTNVHGRKLRSDNQRRDAGSR